MTDVSVADAKAHLSELIERVIAGDTVRITRRGKVVAQITGVAQPRRPVDVADLRALTDSMPLQAVGAGEFVRAMRDSDRY